MLFSSGASNSHTRRLTASALRREALEMAVRVTVRFVECAAVANTHARSATIPTEVVALGPPWLVLDTHLIDRPFEDVLPLSLPTACRRQPRWQFGWRQSVYRSSAPLGFVYDLLTMPASDSGGHALGEPGTCCWLWWGLGRGLLLFAMKGGMGSPGPLCPSNPFLQWPFFSLLSTAHHGACPWVPLSARNSVTSSGT